MRTFSLLLAALLAVGQVTAQNNCGPAQCYNGCTDARPLVDFVFMLDVSGSMQEERAGIVSGFSTWASNLDSSQINAAYSIVTFADSGAGDPQLHLQLTTNRETFKRTLSDIELSGGWESGLETIRMSLHKATQNFYSRIAFRQGVAKRVLILLTDEDSDVAVKNANRFRTYEAGPTNKCRNLSGYPKRTYSNADWEEYWQPEIDATAQAVISAGDVSLYLLIPNNEDWSDRCLTFYQYGQPQLNIQNGDFSNWKFTETKNAFAGNSKSQRSLQAQLLNANIMSRSFNIDDANKPEFIRNFFEAVRSDISQCDTCFDYLCNAPGGKCSPPVNRCDCTGVRPPTPEQAKVVDCAGVCGGTAVRDCMGVCQGTATYDACGVCAAQGTTSQWCKTDCLGRTFLSSKPNVNYLKTCPSYLDPAGYVVGSNLAQTAANQQWNEAKACEHWRTVGQFNSRDMRQCTFDAEYYRTTNLLGAMTPDAAKAHYLTVGMAQGLAARCQTDSLRRVPPASIDACTQCVPELVSTPSSSYQCYQDCNGANIGTGQSGHFVDSCGTCVPSGTNPDGNKDSCGVCFGGNANLNECGQCSNQGFPPPGLDACLNPLCEEEECNFDCAGAAITTPGQPDHKLDACGFCIPAAATKHAACLVDCKGNHYNSTATGPAFEYDDCGVCHLTGQRSPGCVDDCAGTPGGSGFYDDCGQCISDVTVTVECLRDCANEPYLSSFGPPNIVDYCSLCVPVALANSTVDNCGICTGKVDYDSVVECLQGCDNVWRLRSEFVTFRDTCDRCVIPSNATLANDGIDLCGVCPGDISYNTSVVADANNRLCCTTHLKNCPKQDGSSTFTSCADCPPLSNCTGGAAPDICGRCPDQVLFNTGLDDCGFCCLDPSKCNEDKDDCGVCFGFNINKDPCGRCNNAPGYVASLCKQDCLGNYFLPDQKHAVVDCAGVCNGNNTCSEAICGDGIVTPPELCDSEDPATKDTCNSDCTVIQGASTGAIVGSVIGALAALAILGLAAFLGVRYAIKNGLLGSAKQSVDFGASNSNPLYEGDTKIRSNPLYAA